MKLLIIGAGNVGAQLAYLSLFSSHLDKILLYDIKKELLLGKVLDLNHSAQVLKKDLEFKAVEDLKKTEADIVVITAGMPRTEGMTRFDLLDINVEIVKNIITDLNPVCFEKSIFIMVSNPVDVLTYYFYKISNIKREKIIGLGGILDTARFRYYLHKYLGEKISELHPLVIGPHSKDMLCLCNEQNQEVIKKAIEETKEAGTRIVSFYKGGSAYFAPAMGMKVLLDILSQRKAKIIPVVAVLKGEYGYSDIAFSVPVKLSKIGLEKVIELKLTQVLKQKLKESVKEIENSISYLKHKGLI